MNDGIPTLIAYLEAEFKRGPSSTPYGFGEFLAFAEAFLSANPFVGMQYDEGGPILRFADGASARLSAPPAARSQGSPSIGITGGSNRNDAPLPDKSFGITIGRPR